MAVDDDPVLGAAIANYPSDRARLLMIGGVSVGIVWLVVTFALLNVEEGLAAAITVLAVGVTTMIVGWYIAHLWNREVVLYARGFSYREGSYIAYILYGDVVSIRQHAERQAYFGGLIRRTVYRFTVKTAQDETIVLTNVYRRIGELGLRLEKQVNAVMQAAMERRLARGEAFDFSATLSVTPDGLREGERLLRWGDFDDYKIQDGKLVLFARDGAASWFSIPLADVDNLTLLLGALNERGVAGPH